MKNKFTLYTLIIMTLVLSGLGYYKWQKIQTGKAMGERFRNPPPVSVEIAHASVEDWPMSIPSNGTLTAVNGVELTVETTGVVNAIHFKSGQHLKKGDVLITLSNDILKAQVAQQAAQLKLAKANYERSKTLLDKKAEATATFEADEAKYLSAQALSDELSARLEQTTLKAPFDGQVGIRKVHLGEYLSPGKAVTTLQSQEALRLHFDVTEHQVEKLNIDQPVQVHVSAYPEHSFDAKIVAISPKVDTATKSVLIEAQMLNEKDHPLLPGMFASVTIVLPPVKDIIVLPEEAVQHTLYGDTVFVVKDEQGTPSVTSVPVTIGKIQNGKTQILKGLTGNETVVKTGQMKLHEGSTITYKPAKPDA